MSSSGSAQMPGMSTSLAAPTEIIQPNSSTDVCSVENAHEKITHNGVQDNAYAHDHIEPYSAPFLQDIERRFEITLNRARGLEIQRMPEDGNCLFRAVASQVYGNSELHDLIRHMCVDYMEREKHRFSEFMTEGFAALYCNRKKRDEVRGNVTEVRAISEMLNRSIHVYSYSTYPVYVFRGRGSRERDAPTILLSYHHGNHYNSLVSSRCRLQVSEEGESIGAVMKAQMEHIDEFKASLEAHFDGLPTEETEDRDLLLAGGSGKKKAMDATMCLSRFNLLTTTAVEGDDTEILGDRSGSSSSSAAAAPATRHEGGKREEGAPRGNSVETVLSMGFSDAEALRARRICGDDVEAMVTFLVDAAESADWGNLPVMDDDTDVMNTTDQRQG
ncbi:hypothetical protein M569_11859 [Genlisea aurea]|uniref:ubiquitinyl hydrolase 1 n=1 Tax=Genlisea aurea TaxID=192259 RepID=S8C7Y1_9LAMI|nr:hypothetical protein M569_11859 [Genlisea aurea]